eukprot:gb/GFBE01032185.1/.p1 GENE.gb/GFBE01032185.1/~~gb/GFBE01032185.1/.p1  ORF type:complete len:219 (+),score=38.51 gb/GFBE01032185.1/:1-657(+)
MVARKQAKSFVRPRARPKLTKSLSPKVFQHCYWEVAELSAFCRKHSLPSSGLKAQLAQRIIAFLKTGRASSTGTSKAQTSCQEPRDSSVAGGLKPSTPVKNYKNDVATRDFFKRHCGSKFRFNEYLRAFAKGTPNGKRFTYGDLIRGWQKAENQRRVGKQKIGKQFEYNQFTRDFFAANPGGTRRTMMKAWRTVRSYLGPNTYSEYLKLRSAPRPKRK